MNGSSAPLEIYIKNSGLFPKIIIATLFFFFFNCLHCGWMFSLIITYFWSILVDVIYPYHPPAPNNTFTAVSSSLLFNSWDQSCRNWAGPTEFCGTTVLAMTQSLYCMHRKINTTALTILDLPGQRHKDWRHHKAAVVLFRVENSISKSGHTAIIGVLKMLLAV